MSISCGLPDQKNPVKVESPTPQNLNSTVSISSLFDQLFSEYFLSSKDSEIFNISPSQNLSIIKPVVPKTFAEALAKDPIEELDEKSLTDYKGYPVGNDPEFGDLTKFKPKSGQVVLVGVGGMRSLGVACELGSSEVPQIIIIDNSRCVIKFWEGIKEIAKSAQTADDFSKQLFKFLEQNKDLYTPGKDKRQDKFAIVKLPKPPFVMIYPTDNIETYFENLFARYDFKYIIEMINKTILIKQSWTNLDAFVKLFKTLNKLKIPRENLFVYASNLVAYIANPSMLNKDEAKRVLIIINLLDPILAIHTNLDVEIGFPSKVFLIEDHSAFINLLNKLLGISKPDLLDDALSETFKEFLGSLLPIQKSLFRSRLVLMPPPPMVGTTSSEDPMPQLEEVNEGSEDSLPQLEDDSSPVMTLD